MHLSFFTMPINTPKTYKLVDGGGGQGVQRDRGDRLAMKAKKRDLEEKHRCACGYFVMHYVTASWFLFDGLMRKFVWDPVVAKQLDDHYYNVSFEDCKFPSVFCFLVLAALFFLYTYFESRVVWTTLELLEDENFLKSLIFEEQHRQKEHSQAESELFESNPRRARHLLQSRQGSTVTAVIFMSAWIVFLVWAVQSRHDPNCGVDKYGWHKPNPIIIGNVPSMFGQASIGLMLQFWFLQLCVFCVHKCCLRRAEDTDSESE